MDINKDIQDAITRNLPQAVGAQLQAVLGQGVKDAAEVESLKRQLIDSDAARKSFHLETDRLKAALKKHGELDERTSSIADRERSITVRELQQELAAEKRISQFATDTVSRLVRNVEYRNTSIGSMPVALAPTPPGVGSSYGTPGYVASGPVTDSSSKSAE